MPDLDSSNDSLLHLASCLTISLSVQFPTGAKRVCACLKRFIKLDKSDSHVADQALRYRFIVHKSRMRFKCFTKFLKSKFAVVFGVDPKTSCVASAVKDVLIASMTKQR